MGPKDEELGIESDRDDDDVEGDDDTDNEGDDEGDDEDRGDVVDPEVTSKNLKAVAGDEEDEEAEEEGGGSRAKTTHVPYARFKETNDALQAEREARIRAEERARIREEQAAGAAGAKKKDEAPEFDVEAKEVEYGEALIQGDTKLAASIRKEINAHLRAEAEEAATAKAEARLIYRENQRAINEAAAEMIEQYPFLDSQSTKANKEAIAEVIEMRDFFMAKGKAPAEALRKAVERVAPLYGKAKAKPKAGDDDADDDDGEEEKPEDALARRRREIRERNARSASAIPSKPEGGIGNRASAGKLDPEKMSEKEWENLPEREKAKMRGDQV